MKHDPSAHYKIRNGILWHFFTSQHSSRQVDIHILAEVVGKRQLPAQQDMDSASQVFKYSLVFLVAMNVNLVPANNTGGTCQPGLDCIHGYCPAGTVNCVCEEGWAGFRCEQPCPKDCVMNGACHTSPEGIPYCSCHVGYTLVNGIGCVRENTTVTPPKAEGERHDDSIIWLDVCDVKIQLCDWLYVT